jgi:hypothetical protein
MPSTVFVTPNEQIASNYNNAGMLALITSISVNSVPFLEVQSLARWTRGEPRIATNGIYRFAGKPSTEWQSSFLTLQQWEYLKDTYEGKCTVKTLTDDDDTYANYNSILYIGQLSDYKDRIFRHTVYGKGIQDFIWYWRRLEAL